MRCFKILQKHLPKTVLIITPLQCINATLLYAHNNYCDCVILWFAGSNPVVHMEVTSHPSVAGESPAAIPLPIPPPNPSILNISKQ